MFFKTLVNTDVKEYLLELLVPEVSASVTITAAIELPRKWMIPVDPTTMVPSTDETELATFQFAETTFFVDSQSGLNLNADLALSSTTPVSIGKTGLIANINRLKLDLNEGKNIPEITLDGRPNSFKGVYVEECDILFPPNWNIQNKEGGTEPPHIIAKNLIVGNEGGVSGDFTVEGANEEYMVNGFINSKDDIFINFTSQQIEVRVVDKDKKNKGTSTFSFVKGLRSYYLRDQANNYFLIDSEGEITSQTAPTGILNFKIGNKPNKKDNLQLALDSFSVSVRQNKVQNAACVGYISIPRKDKDALVVQVTISFDDGFLVKALFPKEQSIVDNAWVNVMLGGLEIGKVADKKHFAFKGSIEVKPKIPFIQKFLPQHIKIKDFLYQKGTMPEEDVIRYEIGMEWKSGTSITAGSDGPTEIRIPIHKPSSADDGSKKRLLQIKELKVVVEKKDADGTNPAHLSTMATFIESQLNLGAINVELSGLGFNARTHFPDGGGNFGDAQIDMDFVPPKSGKLSIETPIISGGGAIYYNDIEGSFDGVIELTFSPKPKAPSKPDPSLPAPAKEGEDKEETKGISIKGIVCLQTNIDGSKGFSLMIILTAEFDDFPIPLGMGFKLLGLGGLLGLNRSADIDALRGGVRDGSLESILFPKDPVDNAAKIISNVKKSFPAVRDRFIVGPLAKITWGEPDPIIKAKIGIFIELPNPVVLAILGVAEASVPVKEGSGKKKPIVINLAFMAVIDFGKKVFSLDASLYDSELAGITLSGDMALRLFWGEKKYFLLTIGGFHPAFEVPPINLPTIRRLALSIRDTDDFKLKALVYAAITSNTFQFGAELILEGGGGKYKAKARFWLDVLFRFNPFNFIADIGAEAGIYRNDKSILSAYLRLTLQGPKPYIANGTARFKVAGISAEVSFHKSFGEEENYSLEPKDVWILLKNSLEDANNWSPEITRKNNSLVTLKKLPTTSAVKRFEPLGGISVTQKITPFNRELKKFGVGKPKTYKKYEIDALELDLNGTPEAIGFSMLKEEFAPAEFTPMSDEQKLSAPSFVDMDAGVSATEFAKPHCAYHTEKVVEYELILLDKQFRTVVSDPQLRFPSYAEFEMDKGLNTASNNSFSARNNTGENQPNSITIDSGQYTIVNNSDLSTYGSTEVWFNDKLSASEYMSELWESNPSLKNTTQIVDDYEFANF